ncbi:carbamoyltransferase C-terminal domain-containing protein [uncultured Arcticibacterium sp.]|uniref:carbamoyltransferase family protein n=1 Tax=uncultured Arcticibacterium sp. TaxID=2173042 RepID=UPI0030F9915E
MKDCYLGLSTSGHDPALALVDQSGNVIFAEATERHVQLKRAWGISPDHPDHLRSLSNLIDRKTNIQISRTWMAAKSLPGKDAHENSLFPPTDFNWLYKHQNRAFDDAGIHVAQFQGKDINKINDFDHHLCHAVNASYNAPFDSGLCIVIDGEGEVGSLSIFLLKNRELKRIGRAWGPGSFGSYYSWLTQLCGFDWRLGEEWKVMGLAAFGRPNEEMVTLLKKTIQIKSGKPYPSSQLTLHELTLAAKKFMRLPGEDIMKAADLAASGQAVYAFWIDEILKYCQKYEQENLILSGGCALNSSYNGTIKHRFQYKNIFVPSAPADDGNALGSALLSWMKDSQTQKIPSSNGTPYLGTNINNNKLEKKISHIAKYGGFSRITDIGNKSASMVAKMLSEGKIIGVIRGRAEFGPRALGNRSILADPRSPQIKEIINERVKGREAYRPFAPIVPDNRVSDYFLNDQPSPYMSFTIPWKGKMLNQIPGVVHKDGTGRLQTVNSSSNPWLNDLLLEFEKITNTPILLNTSFNVMGKPIVHSIEDAMAVLVTTGLDAVLIENVLIEK